MSDASTSEVRRKGFLDTVERVGNALPDPVFIFIGIIVILMGLSVVGSSAGWQAVNPVTGELLKASNLLNEANVQKLLVEMPKTYTGFTPLGLALTIMLGASVADRSGLLATLLRASLANVQKSILVPTVFVIGMLTTHAIDAGYLVYVPLAGLVFAAAGRHPILGLIVGFAGAAVGLSGNLLPGQYDVLMFGITETGAHLIDKSWTMNPLGNWYFSIGIAVVFTIFVCILVDRVIEPRLGPWHGTEHSAELASSRLNAAEKKGINAALIVLVAVVAGFVALMLWPGFSPLIDESAEGVTKFTPFFRALPAGLAILFFSAGWAYGARAGTIHSHRHVVQMMVKGLEPFVPYLVLVFFAAHFVAMFGWSNLGPIFAISGAEQLKAMHAPPALLLPMLTTMSAWLDFLIASGSAKWSAMAPVVTPMLMLLGISPEMTTAAYRVGDTVTNLISPLNPYFVLTLTFCQRWIPGFRLGTLLSMTLPLAIAFYFGGVFLTATWVALDLPVGPGAAVSYQLPNLPITAP